MIRDCSCNGNVICHYSRLYAYWRVLMAVWRGHGILIFTGEPTPGDTITVGKMRAEFQSTHE
jgi:hypothetical protein